MRYSWSFRADPSMTLSPSFTWIFQLKPPGLPMAGLRAKIQEEGLAQLQLVNIPVKKRHVLATIPWEQVTK